MHPCIYAPMYICTHVYMHPSSQVSVDGHVLVTEGACSHPTIHTQVSVDGHVLATKGAGDAFGEMALLSKER